MINGRQQNETERTRGFTARDYMESHEAYRRCSDQRDQIRRWFETTELLRLRGGIPRVLSVGAGAGDIDIALLELLDDPRRAFAYDAIDPNRESLERFAARCGELDPTLANRVTLHHGMFETFEPDHRYDLIHFIHSIYATGDVPAAVQKAYRLLSPGGQLALVCSTDEGINRFKRRVFESVDLPNRSASVPERQLIDALCDLESAETEFDLILSEIDVTRCFEQDDVGSGVLSFILQVDFSALEPWEQERVLEALAEEAVSTDGRRVLRQPMLGITVRARHATEARVPFPVRRQPGLGLLACPARG